MCIASIALPDKCTVHLKSWYGGLEGTNTPMAETFDTARGEPSVDYTTFTCRPFDDVARTDETMLSVAMGWRAYCSRTSTRCCDRVEHQAGLGNVIVDGL